jgi:hypothetical protein
VDEQYSFTATIKRADCIAGVVKTATLNKTPPLTILQTQSDTITVTDEGYTTTNPNACGLRTYTVTGEAWTTIALTTGAGDSTGDTYTITSSPIVSTFVDT